MEQSPPRLRRSTPPASLKDEALSHFEHLIAAPHGYIAATVLRQKSLAFPSNSLFSHFPLRQGVNLSWNRSDQPGLRVFTVHRYHSIMPFKPDFIQPYLDSYREVTGKVSNRFICPITDRGNGTESKGHILNEVIKNTFAAQDGQAVPMYNEVDGHFGKTVELDFIQFAMDPAYSFGDYLKLARHRAVAGPDGKRLKCLWVIFPDGREFPLIKSSGNGKPPYNRKMIVKDDAGNDMEYYIETNETDLPLGVATVDARNYFRYPAVLASLWKAAFLALFQIFKYTFVYSRVGEFVRKPLAEFVNQQSSVEDATKLFEPVRNAFNVFACSPKVAYPVRDTLRDKVVLMHFNEIESVAVSVLFDVMGSILILTLPVCAHPATDGEWETALNRYFEYLDDPSGYATCTVSINGTVCSDAPFFGRNPLPREDIPAADLPSHLIARR